MLIASKWFADGSIRFALFSENQFPVSLSQFWLAPRQLFGKALAYQGILTAEWDQHLPEMQSFQPLSFKYIQTCLTKKSMYFFIFERKGIRGTKYGYLLATLWLKQSEEFTFLEYFIFFIEKNIPLDQCVVTHNHSYGNGIEEITKLAFTISWSPEEAGYR